MIKKINKFLVRTPLHKTALELKTLWISSNWIKENTKILDNRTIYCISPYKTGTTFLASSFERTISKHEPLHHASVRKLNQDFERFFVQRLNSLNLKLECSGFLSAYVEKLAQTEITKDLTYICVLRKPSSWVTSVVNHHQIVKEYGQHYFWGNELFWKKHVGVNLANFFMSDESEKLEVVEKLIEFYISFTRKTEKLKNVNYVWIKDLQGFLPTLGQLIGEEAKPENSKKNKALMRKFVYENKKIDAAYEQLVCELLTRR
jgi:hypothetical protein